MNSKNIKRIISIIILVMLLFSVKSFAVVSATSDFYVNDYAGVLTANTKKIIMDANIELQQKTGAQIVIVTVQSLEGKSIESYATELFRKIGIGESKKNNGVLLLCSTGDREFRIEVGYGLEGALTDGKTGRIQDEYIIPYLKNNNYDEGIKNGFAAILDVVSEEYNISINNSIVSTRLEVEENKNVGEIWGLIIHLLIWLLIIIYAVKKDGVTLGGSYYRGGHSSSSHSSSSHSSGGYHGGGGRSGGGGSSRRF